MDYMGRIMLGNSSTATGSCHGSRNNKFWKWNAVVELNCIINLLFLFPCASVGDNTHSRVSHFLYSHT